MLALSGSRRASTAVLTAGDTWVSRAVLQISYTSRFIPGEIFADAGAHMTQHPGNPAGLSDPHDIDLFEFAQSGRQAAGAVRVSQLPRMLNEVPADAPDRDTVFTWQAEGSTQPELQDNGIEAPQPYLRLAVHGSVWIECQRCLSPYSQHLDVDATYRIVTTEDEADEFPLD